MTATLARLQQAAKHRAPGYLDAALTVGVLVAPEAYEFDAEALEYLKAFRKSPSVGLGTVLQRGIHAVLDVTPMPAKTRAAIKSCKSCGQRAAKLNRLVPRIPFASPPKH